MLHPYDRPTLKAQAKAAMRKASPTIYLVSLICLLLTNAPTFVTEFPTMQLMVRADSLEQMLDIYYNSSLAEPGFALQLATLAMNIFLGLVSCGYRLYALRASRSEEPGGLETLFACFRQFGRFLTATLLMELFVALWSLLFVIPGILAALSYSQTIFIMLDDPDITPMEAIAASKRMMQGHKGEYFLLSLSFFGWLLLSLFTLGILDIWLYPYQSVTFANYYNALSGWTPYVPEPEAAEPEFTVEDWWKQ